ncbi:MAG: tRNA-dihydrouridine synthase [Patescibacteria group bacterium]
MASFWQNLKLTIKPFFVLAPMDGVTDYVFREIISETAKPDVLFTEFTSVDALLSKGYEKTIPRLKFSQRQRPIVAQIWGTNPQFFYKVATIVKDLGFDGIDINMGCPDKNVMKIGSGAALINTPSLAAEIILASKEGAKKLPVSVKTRLAKDPRNNRSWFNSLLNQNLDALTIHGRRAKDLSKSLVQWDEISQAVKMRSDMGLDTVIIGNGAIKSFTEALEVHTKYGVDGLMIGTGVFSNPWVFEKEPKNHTKQEHLDLLLKHTKLYCQTYQNQSNFAEMRKFFKIYARAFSGADKLKKQLMTTTNYQEVEDLVKRFLE